jgi:hypothetical protein
MKSMTETIEWHRADEVLPDADTDVLCICAGEIEAWMGFLDGDQWRKDDGWPVNGVLFWAYAPTGPWQ